MWEKDHDRIRRPQPDGGSAGSSGGRDDEATGLPMHRFDIALGWQPG
jgi:hypothetical protein